MGRFVGLVRVAGPDHPQAPEDAPDRGQEAEVTEVADASTYGRPLVREGVNA